ncbi:DUF4007 family protein [Laspinema olomoucense]|uniref:DUF4007 family protein n=1 Tax=Laspinema olomoucense TaxID=3231600 RepID=UPI0021BB9B50|nr:DUF4007 family protein [Laspinema sp. D3a]MCT7989027.1 DUF4007 family protein [Laspinema sp. D3a]
MQQLQLNLGTHFWANFADVRGSHQGLHPKALRLRRVWDAIANGIASVTASSPLKYSRPEIPARLGIGSRQFASTVYWLVVLKLAEYQQKYLMPTERGRWLFEKFDPYLEYAETPCLLHYWGLEPPCLMPSWWWLFNRLNHPEFEEDGVRSQLTKFLQTHTERRNPAEMAKKDLTTILGCYQRPESFAWGRGSLFSPLRLIRTTEIEYGKRSGKTGFYTQYSWASNNRGVPTQWIVLATVQYAKRKQTDQIPLAQLAYQPNSPGQIFKLGEDAIANHLEQAEGIELAFDTNNRLQAKISDSFQHSSNGIPNFC